MRPFIGQPAILKRGANSTVVSFKDYLRLFSHIQLMPVLEAGEETLVGGQAVMEGVMMRAPHSYCVAVRRASGEIVTEEAMLPKVSEKYPIFKLPVFRGIGTLGQAMHLGMKALQFSANVGLEDEAAKEAAAPPAKKPWWQLWMLSLLGFSTATVDPAPKKETGLSSAMMWVQVAFSVGFFIVLYKFLPLMVTDWATRQYPVFENHYLFNALDGVIRIVLFLGVMFGMSRFQDIHRVFQFHGAEHKVVFNYESKRPVTVENAQSFVTWHPRCGTSFLLVVMLVSMLTYMFLPPGQSLLAKFLSRIALILPVAGISYEIIRFAAKRRGSWLSVLTAPGLWLQRITTQAPDDRAVEVAIHALNGAMELEAKQGGELVIA